VRDSSSKSLSSTNSTRNMISHLDGSGKTMLAPARG
jgi:hypothetical protein